MAHFCELDSNNVVLRVIVVANSDTSDANGNEVESIGVAFCQKLFGGNWKQTSYHGNIRKNYAGIGTGACHWAFSSSTHDGYGCGATKASMSAR